MRAALIALGILAGCQSPALGDADHDAIRAVLDRQREAWNAGDVEGFMDGYDRSPAIVFTSGAEIRRGFEETLASYRKRYADDNAMGQLQFSDVEIRDLGSEAAVVLGHWQLSETPQAGRGVFSLVFVRVDGRWKIVHDHSSSHSLD